MTGLQVGISYPVALTMTMNALHILKLLYCYLLLEGASGQVHNTVVGTQSTETKTQCVTQADILFIMDSSGSIMPTDYDTMLQFVTEITRNFNIGPNDVQFGAIIFGTYTLKIFNFTTYTDHAQLEQGILGIQHISGQTYTDKALQLAREDAFTAASGARPGVPKLAIVFTDGQSSDPAATAQQSELLKQSGVSVMSIGIGSAVVVSELETIASVSSDVFQVAGFDVLQNIETQVANKTCEMAIQNQSQPEDCRPTADIIFLLDASSNFDLHDFNLVLQVVSTLTNSSTLGPNDIQFGVITFANTARRDFDLDTYTDHAALKQAILNIPLMQGGLRVDLALQLARLESFTTAHGARRNTPRIAVVTVAGPSTDPSATASEVQLLKDSGVGIISIGIGPSTDPQELEMLASTPSDVFTVLDYQTLDSILNQIKTMCD